MANMLTWMIAAVVVGVVGLLVFRWRRLNHTMTFITDSRFKRVLIVTSHPDDECMFFSPLIVSLARRGEFDIFLLCLSSGNYNNLGRVRQKELIDSARILGIRQNNVFVLDRRDLQDDPKITWDKSIIAKIVSDFVKNYYIDVIFTFDEQGVSGHANHISVYHGVRHFLEEADYTMRVEGYKLISINVILKYLSITELAISSFMSNLIFVSRWTDVWRAQRAMYAHKSQFVWFRALYILFSRYMIINTFEPILDRRKSCQN